MNIRFPLCLTRKGPGYYLNDATGRTVAAMTADKEDAEFILLACNRHHDLLAANQMRIHVFVDRMEQGRGRCPTLISADVPENTTADDFRSRITAAVSQWAKTDDEEARRMIESACVHFNAGDLASCDLDSGALASCLAEQDVRNLIIESVQLGNWKYDTPLVQLEEAEE
jgi:hypothetical protein